MKYFTKFLSQLYDLYKESSYFTTPNVNFDQSENTISNVDYQYNIESKSSNVDYNGNFYEFPNKLRGFFKLKGKILTHPIPNEYIEQEEQSIVIAGIGTGTMYYRLGDSGEFSTSIPTITNIGTYTLYYYCEENDNYTKSSIYNINININIKHDYSQDYLTIVSLEDNNTIGWKAYSAEMLKTISISTDNGQTWTDKTSSTAGTTLATLNNGNKLLIKGNNSYYGSESTENYFTSTQNFDVEGNIMSLLYGYNFINQISLPSSDHTFIRLFWKCSKLISAKNLIMPATTLRWRCYNNMFYDCSQLIETPNLPATTLVEACYQDMFRKCTSLVTAPTLPATTLAERCYQDMFNGCTSLVNAPELSATMLQYMCYTGMFLGCTSLTTAPELPATILATQCYQQLFQNCSSLNYIKCLATNISATNCTNYWIYGVAATGTFVKNPDMTSWTTGNNGIPSGWTVQDAA